MNENEPHLKSSKPSFGIIFFFVMIICLVVFLLFGSTRQTPVMKYSDFLECVTKKQVQDVVIQDEKVINARIITTSGDSRAYLIRIPYVDSDLLKLLKENNVSVSGTSNTNIFIDVILPLLPMLLMVFLFFIIIKQNTVQNSKGMQFGKSRARIFDRKGKKLTFNDVAGQEEAKRELAEIVDFLKNTNKYISIGAEIPKGILLVGSPGTGKTMLARAVAGEADVPFLHISGSDFVEMFVGVGASRVRDLFDQARKLAPAIIFIDELDAVGRARGSGLGGGHDEREQTLNQMLVEMDGFDSTTGIIVLAATNRPDVLDPALLRPGRFDRQVNVSLPDIKEREAILAVHTKKVELDGDVDLAHFARATPGMSGADLANMVNESAIFAARRNKKTVGIQEFEDARDKILMGVARESMIIPEKERVMTAGHEAGHALMYYFVKNASPLHKVTIIPRGRALGLTIGIPLEDSYSHTKSWLDDQLVILFGGYAAEKVLYGETTTGTQNDIQRATELAHKMVCEWGMSEDIGAVSYGQEEAPIFMGKEIARHKDYSEFTAQQIDKSVRKILDNAEKRAVDLLNSNKELLDKLSKALLEHETMDDAEIRTLLGFEPLVEYQEV